MRRRHNNGAFALYFTVLVMSGYLLGDALGLMRFYWVPLTITIVTVYDAFHSVHRLIQRLVGSLIGVVAGAVVIQYVHNEWLLAGLVVLLSCRHPRRSGQKLLGCGHPDYSVGDDLAGFRPGAKAPPSPRLPWRG